MATVTINERQTITGVNPQFLERWSPRALSKKSITHDVLERICEAARWSPSCYNEQPWQIVTSCEENFTAYLGLLDSFNQAWAKHASVLGFIVTNTTFAQNANVNHYAGFDCGAAWMAMSLQALQENVYMHAMGGIDVDATAKYLGLSDNQKVMIGFAMGYKDDKKKLPTELQEREKPSGRKPLAEIWNHGKKFTEYMQ